MVAMVKTPFALLQKPVKVVRFDAVETPQMTLGLVPEVLDAVDVILLVSKEG